jgi:Zn-dependent M16 (insulinase) family peptidase
VVSRVHRVADLDLAAIRLTHAATGAELLHVARDDAACVFG